jgi:hypothetical protein
MGNKNNLATVGFALAFANIVPTTAHADQSGRVAHGDFVTISAESSGQVNLFPHRSEVTSIYEASREKLNEKAIEACSGRAFSIDDSSIEYTGSDKPGTGRFRIFTVSATARVFCMDGE